LASSAWPSRERVAPATQALLPRPMRAPFPSLSSYASARENGVARPASAGSGGSCAGGPPTVGTSQRGSVVGKNALAFGPSARSTASSSMTSCHEPLRSMTMPRPTASESSGDHGKNTQPIARYSGGCGSFFAAAFTPFA
jgi:hypothetical protein